jgi:ribosomal protein L37E
MSSEKLSVEPSDVDPSISACSCCGFARTLQQQQWQQREGDRIETRQQHLTKHARAR